MIINKKIIVGIIGCTVLMTGVGVTTHSITTNADQVSYQEVVKEAKEQLQSELDEKYTKQIEEKDSQIQDLQSQLNLANQQISNLQQTANAEQNNKSSVDKDYVDSSVKKAKQETETKINEGDKEVTSQITYKNVEKNRQEEAAKQPPIESSDSSAVPESQKK